MQVQISQCSQPKIHGLQLCHVACEFVRHQPEVLRLKAVLQDQRQGWRDLYQRFFDGVQNGLRLARLDQYLSHPARQSQIACLGFSVVGAVEHHLGLSDVRVGAQLAHKLVTVHGGHEDVGDNKLWPFSAHHRQGLRTIGGLQRLVAAVTDEGDHQRSIGGDVIYNKYLRHFVFALRLRLAACISRSL